MINCRILPAGDCALVVEFGKEIDPKLNSQVQFLRKQLEILKLPYVIETVPTFCSLLIYYNPILVSFGKLKNKLNHIVKKQDLQQSGAGNIIEIPVCYDADYGPDMENLMMQKNMTRDEIIHLHTQPQYLIYMLGFLPGFAYLGGLHPSLHAKRLDNPRTVIPAGSVGIGGEQTGIYPLDSPGGWQLIGRTPVRPYDKNRSNPFLYQAGDSIKFVSVTQDEYYKIESGVLEGSYICQVKKGGIVL